MPGRPTKLDADLQRSMVRHLRRGLTIEATCDIVGIDRQSYYNWMERGEQGEEPYLTFFGAIKQAMGQSEAVALAVVRKAALGWIEGKTVHKVDSDGKSETTTTTLRRFEWQAAAWMLERRFPDKYSRTVKVDEGEKAPKVVKAIEPTETPEAQP